jgi:hypothetical protein
MTTIQKLRFNECNDYNKIYASGRLSDQGAVEWVAAPSGCRLAVIYYMSSCETFYLLYYSTNLHTVQYCIYCIIYCIIIVKEIWVFTLILLLS